MTSWTAAVATAVFVIWMQRRSRWAFFYQAMQGNLVLKSNPTSTGSGTPHTTTTPGKKPSTTTPKAGAKPITLTPFGSLFGPKTTASPSTTNTSGPYSVF